MCLIQLRAGPCISLHIHTTPDCSTSMATLGLGLGLGFYSIIYALVRFGLGFYSIIYGALVRFGLGFYSIIYTLVRSLHTRVRRG